MISKTFVNLQMAKRTTSDLTPLASKLTPSLKRADVKETPFEHAETKRVAGRPSKLIQNTLKTLLATNFLYQEGNLHMKTLQWHCV